MRKPLPFHRRVGRFIDRNPGQMFTYAFAAVFGIALGTLVALGI